MKVTINIKAGVVIVEGKTDEENNHQFWAQALAIAETMVATTAHPTSASAAADAAEAAADGRSKTLHDCADIMRKHYPAVPTVEEPSK